MKRVNSREIEIISIAIDKALEHKDYKENGAYAVLGDEMKEIKKKIHMRRTKVGNILHDAWMGWYGFDGSEYTLMESWFNKGYEELYYSAPYYWAVVNKKERTIFTYTEGDTGFIERKNKEKFIEEIKSIIDFLKESGQASVNEAKSVLAEVIKNERNSCKV